MSIRSYSILALAIVAGLVGYSFVKAQQTGSVLVNPQDVDAWAVTPPTELDPSSSTLQESAKQVQEVISKYKSMSPDSWGSTEPAKDPQSVFRAEKGLTNPQLNSESNPEFQMVDKPTANLNQSDPSAALPSKRVTNSRPTTDPVESVAPLSEEIPLPPSATYDASKSDGAKWREPKPQDAEQPKTPKKPAPAKTTKQETIDDAELDKAAEPKKAQEPPKAEQNSGDYESYESSSCGCDACSTGRKRLGRGRFQKSDCSSYPYALDPSCNPYARPSRYSGGSLRDHLSLYGFNGQVRNRAGLDGLKFRRSCDAGCSDCADDSGRKWLGKRNTSSCGDPECMTCEPSCSSGLAKIGTGVSNVFDRLRGNMACGTSSCGDPGCNECDRPRKGFQWPNGALNRQWGSGFAFSRGCEDPDCMDCPGSGGRFSALRDKLTSRKYSEYCVDDCLQAQSPCSNREGVVFRPLASKLSNLHIGNGCADSSCSSCDAKERRRVFSGRSCDSGCDADCAESCGGSNWSLIRSRKGASCNDAACSDCEASTCSEKSCDTGCKNTRTRRVRGGFLKSSDGCASGDCPRHLRSGHINSNEPCACNTSPNFVPTLGHRSANATIRNGNDLFNNGGYHSGDCVSHDEFPPFNEILATGKYFGVVDMNWLVPTYQGNTAISVLGGTSVAFDNDLGFAPGIKMGFESQYGPGAQIGYWQFDHEASPVSFTNTGAGNGSVNTWMIGPSAWSRLPANVVGETLTVNNSLEAHVAEALMYKPIRFKRAYLTGKFGVQYVSIRHEMFANLSSGGDLISTSTFHGFGPKAVFEYVRRIGHTPLEFVSGIRGSLLFGEQDQFVSNTYTGDISNLNDANEFMTMLDYSLGLQRVKKLGMNRSLSVRIDYVTQAWIGGGTPVDPTSDFGFRGFRFGFGFNR